MKRKELIDVCPIKQIEDGKMVNHSLDITVGFTLVLPEVFTLSDADAAAMDQDFDDILHSLPEGTLLHMQNLFYVKRYENEEFISDFVHKSTVDMLRERHMMAHTCRLFITFVDKMSLKKPKDVSKAFNELSIFTNIFKNINTGRFERIDDLCRNLLHQLNNIKYCSATRMNDFELAASIYEYLNQSYDTPSAADSSIQDAVLNPIGFNKKKGVMMVGGKYVSVVSLVNEGPEMASMKEAKIYHPSGYQKKVNFSESFRKKVSLVYPLGIGLAINHILNVTIQVVSNEEIMTALEIEKRSLGPFAEFGHVAAKRKVDHIEAFMNNLKNNNLLSCFCHVDVVVQANDIESLKLYNDMVCGHFTNMNKSKGIVENYECETLFFLSCPGNANWNYRVLKSVTENAVRYLHKETHYLKDEDGMLLTDRFGTPLKVSFKTTKGSHKVIYGPTGAGKSFFMNEYVNQALLSGSHVVILDIGGSYKRLCEIHEGVYFDSGNRELMSFNIFLCRQDPQGNYVYLNKVASKEDAEDEKSHINFIVSCIKLLLKGKETFQNTLNPMMETTLIEKSVMAYYDHVNENKLFPDFDGYYHFMLDIYANSDEYKLNHLERYFDMTIFKMVLEQYVKGGSYERLLNSKSNIDLVNAQLVVFDAKSITKNPVIFSLFCIIVMQLFTNKINRLPRSLPKEMINDEALDFLRNEEMGEYIAFLYRTARKLGASIELATQSVSFISSLPEMIMKSIVVNTSVYILLNHRGYENLYPDLRKIHAFTENDLNLLSSLINGEGFREVFIKIEDKPRVYRVGLSKLANALYSTTPDVVDEINSLYNQYGSYKLAVLQYIENMKKNNLIKTSKV